jgi:hypothetical protein
VRLFLIGEHDDLPLHVAAETTPELADAFGRVDGYRFVTSAELVRLPGGREALRAWDVGDDSVFREHTRLLQETIDAEETTFDEMAPTEREAWLRPRLLDAGHHPAEVERLIRERRRKGFRVVDADGSGSSGQSR